MDVKDSYLHGTIGVVKSISVNADKLTYTLADINQTATTITLPVATQSANGLLSSADKIKLDKSTGINQSIPYIVGPDTDTTAGTWTGTYSGITEYNDGLTIIYVPKVAGASTTTLNINGIGSKVCYYSGSSKLTTHYPAGTPILLTYSGGYWKRADYYYDSLQLRVYRQTTGYDADYPILVSRTLASSIGTSGSDNSYSNIYGLIGNDTTKTPTINPLTGEIKAPKFTGTFNGTANSVANSLTLKIKSGATEGTSLYTYNGAANKTLDIKQGDNVTLTAAEGSLTIASSDSKVTQTDNNDSSYLRVLLSSTANNDTYTGSVKKSSKLYFNPSSGVLQTIKFKGIWEYDSDSRSVSTIPSDYKSAFKFVGIKNPSAVGLTRAIAGTYVSLFGWKGYSDNSGPHSWELASGNTQRIYVRSGVGIQTSGAGDENWNDWNTLAYTSDIPTKVSQLTNDSGYLTEHQSLSNYVTLNTEQTITGAKTFNSNLILKSTIIKGIPTNEGDGDSWIQLQGYPNYGIRYYNAGIDKMAFSASGNNQTVSGADLCINGNGDGTVTIRGKSIWHKGNLTNVSQLTNDSGYLTNIKNNLLYGLVAQLSLRKQTIQKYTYVKTPIKNSGNDTNNGMNFIEFNIYEHKTNPTQTGVSKIILKWYGFDNQLSSYFRSSWGAVGEFVSNIYIALDSDNYYYIVFDHVFNKNAIINIPYFSSGFNRTSDDSEGWSIGTCEDLNYFTIYKQSTLEKSISAGYVVSGGTSSQFLKADGSVEDLLRIERKTFTAKNDGWYRIGTLLTINYTFGLFTITKKYSNCPSESYLIAIGAGRNATGTNSYNSEFSINLLSGQYPTKQYIQKIRLSKLDNSKTYIEVYITFNNDGSENFQITNMNSDIILQTPELITETPETYKEITLVKGIKTSDKFYGDLVGNSDTASKLTTPRTLWGQSFDGSANISGNMTDVGSISMYDALTLTGTTADKATIQFSRGTNADYPYNYIAAPTGGIISIIPNGLSKLSTNGFQFTGTSFQPATTNIYSLGTASLLWKEIYATTLKGNLDWSYIQNKPTSLPANGGTATNANVLLSKRYDSDDPLPNTTVGTTFQFSNISTIGWQNVLTMKSYSDNNYLTAQITTPAGNPGSDVSYYSHMRWRQGRNSTWGEWRIILDSINYTDYINTTNFPGLNATGTVTSVGLSVPTGFSVSSSPITTSGTLSISFASGYSLPTTAKQTNWDTVYNWYTGVTADDTDALVNKWGEIVDFLDSVAEGTDITDEFVTRKTDQTIDGIKTFSKKIKIANVGAHWLSGKTNASIMYDNYINIGTQKYHPIIGVKVSNDDVVNLGAYINKVGFYGFKSDRTENDKDWEFAFDSNNGSVTHTSNITSNKFITRNGTSSQFVKGNGDLDSTTYATMTQLDDLQNQLSALSAGIKVTASLSVSTIYKNTATSVKITGTTKDNAGNITASEIVIKEGSTILATANNVATTSHTKSVTTTSSSIVFTVTAIAQGLPLSTTVTLYARYPVMYGMGTSAENVYTNGSKASARTSAVSTSTYNATASANNVRFYLLVPSDVTRPTSFTMGGAPVDMVIPTATTTIGGIAYYVFYTNAIYNSGAAVQIKAN